MNLSNFAKSAKLSEATELQRVKLLMCYHQHLLKESAVVLTSIFDDLDQLGYSRPNVTRLRKKISSDKEIIQAGDKDRYRLKPSSLLAMTENMNLKSEEVDFEAEHILPNSLLHGTERYLACISDQINASYEHNIYDGCAVLMRGLIELLLKSAATFQERLDLIEKKGSPLSLNEIIQNVKNNNPLRLNRDTLSCLHDFRKLGNFSAHKEDYNATRADIDNERLKFRAAVEQLVYKSGYKK